MDAAIRCFSTAVAVLLSTPLARADFLAWSYIWSPLPFVLPAEGEGTGGITVTTRSSGYAMGSADTVVGYLTTFSSATADIPDRFINKSYSLQLDLTDEASRTSGSLTFTGLLNGTL